MDHGIWATWYDLADTERERFLGWLHGAYLPFLKQGPGYAWVAHYENTGGGAAMRAVGDTILTRPGEAIGQGGQYVMLVGAPSPHTFLNPFAPDLALPAGFREMLALRREVRTAIFAEEVRVNGPAARERPPGTAPGPAIQMGSFRVRSVEEEFDLARWYAQVPAAAHGADARLHRRAQAPVRRRLGEARDPLRVHLPRGAHERVRRAARGARPRPCGMDRARGALHDPHARLAARRRAHLATRPADVKA